MKILTGKGTVTGAKGFVGKNLCAQLKNIRDGKARNSGFVMPGPDEDRQARPDRASLCIEEIFEYDLDSTPEQMDAWCKGCDFVFNLAGVNRPQNQEEFMAGNFGFASTLLDTLKKHGNTCCN